MWARLAEMITAQPSSLAGREPTPEARNAGAIRALELALARAQKYASIAAACQQRLARELQRQRDRVAGWERRARHADSRTCFGLAGHLWKLKREHEQLLADLQSHLAAAQRDFHAASVSRQAIKTALIESRLVQCVLQGRRAKRDR